MRVQLNRSPMCRLPIVGEGKPRLAVISPGYRFAGAETFEPSRWHELEQFEPNILIGSASDFQRMVERMDFGTLRLKNLDRGIYIVTEIGDRPVSDVQRVVLWQRFGVPVFELFWSRAEGIMAYECEAHQGWHIVREARFAVYRGELVWHAQQDETVIRTGLKRVIDSQPCGCGRAENRIVDADQAAQEEAPLAAIA